MTNATLTFRWVDRSRGDENVGPAELTYTDVVDFAAREVRSTVVGYCDGERVNQSSVRPLPADFTGTPESVADARRLGGWTLVSL